MTRDEENRVAADYFSATGEHLNLPPLDFGHGIMPDEEFYGHAKAAIAAGKPIDWRAILGPTCRERGVLS